MFHVFSYVTTKPSPGYVSTEPFSLPNPIRFDDVYIGSAETLDEAVRLHIDRQLKPPYSRRGDTVVSDEHGILKVCAEIKTVTVANDDDYREQITGIYLNDGTLYKEYIRIRQRRQTDEEIAEFLLNQYHKFGAISSPNGSVHSCPNRWVNVEPGEAGYITPVWGKSEVEKAG